MLLSWMSSQLDGVLSAILCSCSAQWCHTRVVWAVTPIWYRLSDRGGVCRTQLEQNEGRKAQTGWAAGFLLSFWDPSLHSLLILSISFFIFVPKSECLKGSRSTVVVGGL